MTQTKVPVGGTRHIEIGNDLAEITGLNEAVDTFLRERGVAADAATQTVLCVEEVACNAIMHAFDDDGPHTIAIDLSVSPGTLTIEVGYGGIAFDPTTEAEEPDLDASHQDRDIGGLGIHLVRTLMDQVRYTRDGDTNRLTLVKQLA